MRCKSADCITMGALDEAKWVGVGGVVGPAPAASTLWGLAGEMEVLANNNKVNGARGLFDIFH